MHNGRLGSFRRVRRGVLASLTDEAFDVVRGSTDSEHLLALFVDEIVRRDTPPESDGAGEMRDGAMELARRLTDALARGLALVRELEDGE